MLYGEYGYITIIHCMKGLKFPDAMINLLACLDDSAENVIDDMNKLLTDTNSVMKIRYNNSSKRASVRRYEMRL